MAKKIEHLVVLMMEGRSFDHAFGFLETPSYKIDGLDGTETNLDSQGVLVRVTADARYAGDLTPPPGVDFISVNEQIFGNSQGSGTGPFMQGFVKSYEGKTGDVPRSHNIMKCFNPGRLPALTTLAQEYAICDRWFASVPGPSIPNRAFAFGATSLGRVDTNPNDLPLKTIFERLDEHEVASKIYYHDWSFGRSNDFISKYAKKFLFPFDEFRKDCQTNSLPAFSFIEPRYNDSNDRGLFLPAADQSPDHNAFEGEKLIKSVYDSIRRNRKTWESTLLVITYSGHGGLFDHVTPPSTINPNPSPPQTAIFNFERLGVRVPAVLVSPFIQKGTILGTVGQDGGHELVFDHTSIIATARKLFIKDFTNSFLTQRDRNARTFEKCLTLDVARPPNEVNIPQPMDPSFTVAEDPLPADEPIGEEQTLQNKEPINAFQEIPQEPTIATQALADTPSDHLDLLNFSDYADALHDFISSAKTQKPITVGIDAAWGIGKSSLMKMLRKRLTTTDQASLHKKVRKRSTFPTVWFNAWKYSKEEALWAALVLEILEQISKELSLYQRFSLSLRLKIKRFAWKPFFRAVSMSALKFGGTLLVGTIVLIVARFIPIAHKALPESFASNVGIAGIFASIAAVYSIGKNIYKQLFEPLEAKISKYVQDPNYENRVGFLGEFEEDFKRVIELVTEAGNWPLVVFIDDLDRCAPSKAVEVIEAINLLLDSPHCVFVIGMDARTVAKSIEAKYKELKESDVDDPGGLTLGERFLEKIVQISFRIPKSYRDQTAVFINNQLTTFREEGPAETEAATIHQIAQSSQIEQRVDKDLAAQFIEAETRGGKDLAEATKSVENDPSIKKAGLSEDTIRAASDEISARAFEEDKHVGLAVTDAAPYFAFNPRKIKRFINSFRLQARIAQKRGLLGNDGFSVGLLAKAVVILTRWPDVARAVDGDAHLLPRLQEAYKARRLVSKSKSMSATGTARRAAAQAKFDDLAKDERIKKFVNAADLEELLVGINSTQLKTLARCIQLRPLSQEKSKPRE